MEFLFIAGLKGGSSDYVRSETGAVLVQSREFDFRYTHHTISDKDRTDEALRGITGKRLTYRQPRAAVAQ